MADVTNSTVSYMVVVILALAEQVIAIIAGNVPVVSAWFVRLVTRSTTGRDLAHPGVAANLPRTATERFWPDRDVELEVSRNRRLSRWAWSKTSDPYPAITTGHMMASEEALGPGLQATGRDESDRGVEMSELSENGSVVASDEKE